MWYMGGRWLSYSYSVYIHLRQVTTHFPLIYQVYLLYGIGTVLQYRYNSYYLLWMCLYSTVLSNAKIYSTNALYFSCGWKESIPERWRGKKSLHVAVDSKRKQEEVLCLSSSGSVFSSMNFSYLRWNNYKPVYVLVASCCVIYFHPVPLQNIINFFKSMF